MSGGYDAVQLRGCGPRDRQVGIEMRWWWVEIECLLDNPPVPYGMKISPVAEVSQVDAVSNERPKCGGGERQRIYQKETIAGPFRRPIGATDAETME